MATTQASERTGKLLFTAAIFAMHMAVAVSLAVLRWCMHFAGGWRRRAATQARSRRRQTTAVAKTSALRPAHLRAGRQVELPEVLLAEPPVFSEVLASVQRALPLREGVVTCLKVLPRLPARLSRPFEEAAWVV